jgi:hypothetical protein
MPRPCLRLTAAALAIFVAFGLAPAAGAQLRVFIEPDSRTDQDPLRILVTGVWGDSCAPQPVSVTVEGDVVTVLVCVEIPPGILCLSASFAYGYSLDFGPLPAGLYRVELRREILVGDPTEVLVGEIPLGIVEGDGPLLHDRFRIAVEWRDFGGRTGIGRPAGRPTRSSVPMFFFRPDNVEAVVKVLNGCSVNGHYWVLLAAATNVEYAVRIVDTATGAEWDHANPLGKLSAAVADIRAFDCGP